MKRNLLLITFLIFSCFCFSQKSVTWKSLARVKWRTSYVSTFDGYYDIPRFSESIKDLDGKSIRIKGYFIPVDTNKQFIALASRPSRTVFISNGKGSESVLEIIPKEGETRILALKPDKYVEIKGILLINNEDPTRLMYTIKKAELLSEVTSLGGEKGTW